MLCAVLEEDAGVFSVPSKVLTYLCAARPLLLAVPQVNLAARIIHQRKAGLTVPPADVPAFLEAAEQLRANPHLAARCATNAREYAKNTFKIRGNSCQISKTSSPTSDYNSPINHMKGKAVITGAGGFIGGHLVQFLKNQGFSDIRAVDQKPLDDWYQLHANVENLVMDVQGIDACQFVCRDAEVVYNLAADMGGMGFIENNKALCMLSVLINTHMLMAARDNGVKQFFYASSACVYNGDKQTDSDNPGLKEADAYPAMPEDGYGWEKLFSERMCRHFREDYGIQTRYARYHNVYGPHGTWDGGREKAPAAICRKVIQAKLSGKHDDRHLGRRRTDPQLHVCR